MSIKPKIALSQEFLSQLGRFSNKEQTQLLKWAIKFQNDPTGNGINYEKLPMCKDPHLRSVRITQDWRGIIFKPPAGDLYILLHANRHDAAYQWAKNRKMTINPETGAMQLVLIEEVTQTEAPPEVSQAPGFYDHLDEDDLVRIGIPPESVPQVRRITTEAELDALRPTLPVEGYEGLFLVMAGYSVGQVLSEREVFMPPEVDVNDYLKALETPESQSRFMLIEDDHALQQAINSPLEQWRIFLHPSQKRLAQGDRKGPMRVLGGAGTGKTVLAMHRAKWLAEHRTPQGQKVLFTTFTRNLAQDIQENLKQLCAPSVRERIEVINLDRWVIRFLKQQQYPQQIVFNYRDSPLAQRAWEQALTARDPGLGLEDRFYREEWEQVVQSQGIVDLAGYRKAKRAGRRTTLNRMKRDALWPVFDEYRNQLAEYSLKELDDAYHDCAELLKREPLEQRYSAVLVDETQDFGSQALKLLRAMIPLGANDLFLVGDGHQRIYHRNRAVLGRCGIDIRGRSRKLYLNYRTTDEIRKYAVGLLEGREIDDLDGALDESQRYKSLSHGPDPTRLSVGSWEEVPASILNLLDERFSSDAEVTSLRTCVMTYQQQERDQVRSALESLGKACITLDKDSLDPGETPELRLSTMHRSKGLEFDRVIVVIEKNFMDQSDLPEARNLVHVALTRARSEAALILV